MLTDEGDVVVDPFGGSRVTGAVSEKLKREWICCELIEDYLRGARSRFMPPLQTRSKSANVTYSLSNPSAMWDSIPQDTVVADGGRERPLKKQ